MSKTLGEEFNEEGWKGGFENWELLGRHGCLWTRCHWSRNWTSCAARPMHFSKFCNAWLISNGLAFAFGTQDITQAMLHVWRSLFVLWVHESDRCHPAIVMHTNVAAKRSQSWFKTAACTALLIQQVQVSNLICGWPWVQCKCMRQKKKKETLQCVWRPGANRNAVQIRRPTLRRLVVLLLYIVLPPAGGKTPTTLWRSP